MAGAIEVQKLSHTHEQILNWLVLNPHKSMRECADFFGYTQSWLSSLVRSDIFQAALRQRQELVANRVAQSIPERLSTVAQVALDKLATAVEKSEDPEFLLDASDKILHRMGYAPVSARNPGGMQPGQQPAQVVNNNTLVIGASDLAEAREMMKAVGAGQLGGLVQDQSRIIEVPVDAQGE